MRAESHQEKEDNGENLIGSAPSQPFPCTALSAFLTLGLLNELLG